MQPSQIQAEPRQRSPEEVHVTFWHGIKEAAGQKGHPAGELWVALLPMLLGPVHNSCPAQAHYLWKQLQACSCHPCRCMQLSNQLHGQASQQKNSTGLFLAKGQNNPLLIMHSGKPLFIYHGLVSETHLSNSTPVQLGCVANS
jgi:hypothetical protein